MSRIATRRERVIVDLEDNFTGPMARMAASTSLFRKNLDDSGRTVIAFDKTTRDTSPSIDKLSGRLNILARAAAALGPGLVPITTAAVPAIAGLSTQLGFAAAGAGTAVLAFNGVGDSLKALNEYQLEPSQANFEKLQEQLRNLGPAAREFVSFLDTIGPQLQRIRESAQEGMLPGVQDGIDALLDRAPELRRIVGEIADASGDLARGLGEGLSSPRFDEFFAFLEREARPTLTVFGQTVGNLAGGLAELWMAMDPFSDDFSTGLLRASDSFERWAAGLSATEGFQDFLAYVRETGPQVLDTIGSLASMLIDVGTAMAPLGGPVLQGLEAAAEAISAIARSDMGTPIFGAVAAMSALSLATRGWSAAMSATAVTRVRSLATDLQTMSNVGVVAFGRTADEAARFDAAASRTRSTLASLGKTGALLGGVTLATSDLSESMWGANTASLALMGTLLGPWGAAAGAAVGLSLDLTKEVRDLGAAMKAVDAARAAGDIDLMREAVENLEGALEQSAEGSGRLAFLLSTLAAGFGQPKLAEEILGRVGEQAEGAANKIGETRAETERFGNAARITDGLLAGTSDAFRVAAMSVDGFRDSLSDVNALLGQRANFRAYRDSVREFSKAMDEAPDKFRKNGPVFDELQASLDNIAGTALKVAENMKRADRAEFLAKARKDFIEAARAMGISEGRAKRLADQLNLVEKIDPKVDFKEQGADKVKGQAKGVKDAVDAIPDANVRINATDNASRVINGVTYALRNLDGTVSTTYIRTVRQNIIENRLEATNRAQGGYISGPGTGTSDSIPAWLSNGEYVIKAAAVQRYGVAMFDRLNAMRFAQGGEVRRGGGPVVATDDRTPEELRKLREEIKKDRDERKAERQKRAQAARERRQTIRGAIEGFDLIPDEQTPGDAVREQFKQLAAAARELKATMPRTFKDVRERAAGMADKMERLNERLEESRSKLEDWTRERESFEGSVRGTFNNDIFGNGVAGLMLQLEADTNDANARNAALSTLMGKGLSGGGLFQALAASGDLNTAQQLAGMSPQQIAQIDAMFNARAAAQNAGAGLAGEYAFGAYQRQLEATVTRQEAALTTLTLRLEAMQAKAVAQFEGAVARGTEKGAEKGTREGMKDRDKETRQRGRAGR